MKRFLPSEYGHNTGSPAVAAAIPAIAAKAKAVEQLAATSVEWTAVITGLFFDWGFNLGFLGPDVKTQTARVFDEGDTPFSTSSLAVIGRTIVKLLTDADAYAASRNAYIYTASHTTTQAELLAAAEKAAGTKFAVTKVDGKKLLAESKEKLKQGDFSAVRSLIQLVAFTKIDGEALTDYRAYGIFNEKFGVTDSDLEEEVAKLTRL